LGENEDNSFRHSFRPFYRFIHLKGIVASWAEVPGLQQHSAVSNFLLRPGNPFRPRAVGLVVADEESFIAARIIDGPLKALVLSEINL
jgi:hypothetical protein